MESEFQNTQEGTGKDYNTDNVHTEESKSEPPIDVSDYGYDMYPERRGVYKPSWTGILMGREGKEVYEKAKCEKRVYDCIQKSPLIKLMIGALNTAGCKVDLRRHFACEVCDTSITGGYDPILNQVVICQNTAPMKGIVQSVLTHELIHMFDYCENHLDFKNLDHLACTEIRAANLAHCSFLSALTQGDVSPFYIKKMHQECVKSKALASVTCARKVSPEQAKAAVDRVFDRCYNDLEPIGRRIRRKSDDVEKAYLEGVYYGYVS